MSEDFFDAVASANLDLDGMWFDYAEERVGGTPMVHGPGCYSASTCQIMATLSTKRRQA